MRKARVNRLLCVATKEVSWKSVRERCLKGNPKTAFMPTYERVKGGIKEAVNLLLRDFQR